MWLSLHKKHQTDCAISAAYARLASARVRATFETLLRYTRDRAPAILSDAPIRGRHLGVEALANLAWVGRAYVREPATWAGCDGSWQAAISALARHLIGRYRVPVFLGAAWYAFGDPYAGAKRRWFIRHASGVSFRSLDLPLDMTRRMELTTTAQLRAETEALKHCVAKYDYCCWRGMSRIWSLRVKNGMAVRRIATIQFDPQRNAIVQARGYRNRSVSGRARQLLQQWAAREQVRLLA